LSELKTGSEAEGGVGSASELAPGGAADAKALPRVDGSATEAVGAANPRRETAKQRRPPQPILSLRDFYSRRNVSPARFLTDLKTHEKWSFRPEDVAESLAMLRVSDPKFARTAALAAQAIRERDDRFARPCLGFAHRAACERLKERPQLAGVDLEAQANPEEKLRLVGRAVSAQLDEAKHRTEALNVVLTMALWYAYTESLASAAVIDEIASRLVLSADSGRRAEMTRLALIIEYSCRKGPAALKPLLQLVLPWRETAAVELRRASAAEDELRSAKASLTDAENTAARRGFEIDRLSLELTTAQKEIERFAEAAKAAEAHRVHDLAEIRGKLAGALGGHLGDLITTVREALELEPPRTAVAREKIEIAQNELERQLEWLRSSG
jgi:hypothetical protein